MIEAAPALSFGRITVQFDEGDLLVAADGGAARLPLSSLALIFSRYGRPLEDGLPEGGAPLTLPDGARLRPLAYRAPVDVLPSDYAVLETAGLRLAVPQPLFIAALEALARAAAAPR